MLHVEQRHVLVQGDLQQRWINGGGQIQQLLKVEVVTGRESLQLPVVAIPVETQGVGGVEGEVTKCRGPAASAPPADRHFAPGNRQGGSESVAQATSVHQAV